MYITDVIDHSNDGDGEFRRRAGETVPQYGKRIRDNGVSVLDAEHLLSREWVREHEGDAAADALRTAREGTQTAEGADVEVIRGRAGWMADVREGKSVARPKVADETNISTHDASGAELIPSRANWMGRVRAGGGAE
jgi:hypothetical protein